MHRAIHTFVCQSVLLVWIVGARIPAMSQEFHAASSSQQVLDQKWPTGIPFPVSAVRVDPSRRTPPQWEDLKERPKKIPAYRGVSTNIPAEVVEIADSLPVVTPGKGPWHLPVCRNAIGTKSLAKHPAPSPASKLRMRDNAIFDIQFLDMEQGMMSSYVWSMLEDRHGNLWFGTNNGVSRYDGNNFYHFRIQEGLANNQVRSMLEDGNGDLWFGTDGGGLIQYDGCSFTQFTVEGGMASDHVWAIIEDRRGCLWLGTAAGISKYDGSTFTHFSTDQGLPHNSVWCMLEDRDGGLWIGTLGGGVAYYDGSFTIYSTNTGLSSNQIWSLLEDSKGRLWIGTMGGYVNRLEGQVLTRFDRRHGLKVADIWRLAEDHWGNIWISSQAAGVSCISDHSIMHITTKEGLSSDRVWCMLEDSQGKMWFGTRGGGVSRYNDRGFEHLTQNQGLPSNDVWSLCKDSYGNVWIGTQGGGATKFDGQCFSHFSAEAGLANNVVSTILEDQTGDIWIGTTQGLTRYDGNRIMQFREENGLCGNDVQSSCMDRKGNLWFGTLQSGLCRYDGREFIHFSNENGLLSNTIRAVIEDKKGQLWIGTQGGGITKYAKGQFTHYTTKEGLGHNLVWSIFEDSHGDLWFATQGGGVSRYDGIRFNTYTTDHGLSHNWVWSIIEDDNHNLWLGTEAGLTVMVRDSLDYHKFYTYSLGIEDGLKRMDFSQSVLKDDIGNLWWGTSDGLTHLSMEKFQMSADPPTLQLKQINISQKYLDFRQLRSGSIPEVEKDLLEIRHSFDSVVPFENYPLQLHLPHDYSNLTFRFSAIDWSAPHKVQFSFFMEGLDMEWSEWSSENVVTYRNLSPGIYRLKTVTRGAALTPSNPFLYDFTIEPPWWLTWWAKVFYGLGMIIGMVGIVKWRTHSLKQRQRELEKMVTARTAEVEARTQDAIKEQNRSQELLLNILPAAVAKELKDTGHTKPVYFDEVSILFADFIDFTNIVASIPGKKLVSELDEIFQEFDDIIEETGLEKIQTVGDTYVAASGLPKTNSCHAVKCIEAAQKMLSYLELRNLNHSIKWKIRVGVHSGPVTAGVVGKRKFTYDIFGDTVNIASRLEGASAEGRINISAYTCDLVKDIYRCEYRGKMNVKGKGYLDMYFVDRRITLPLVFSSNPT